jgi:UDPglucose 6-dehydrogenase
MERSLEGFNVGVVGAGYVGLVTGACLAHLGNRVDLVDVNAGRVESLERGEVPIYEPGLKELMVKSTDRMLFTTKLAPVVCGADIIFIAVDTPPGVDGSADLFNVADVARTIGYTLSGAVRERPLIIVNKSTVPVGSGDYVSMLVQEGADEAGTGRANFQVVSNPEFLREGSAVYDSLFPDRIILGAGSQEALDTMRALYEPIIEQRFPTNLDPRPKVAVPFITTDLASSEMIKYAANAFLATKISFINEIANICELVGADVTSVAAGMGLDSRIGSRFLNAGIGWGGSCFPKDVSALRTIAAEYDYEAKMLSATVEVNDRQRRQVISKLQRDLRTLKGKRVALMGLVFKPDTDDLRGAPSLEIARLLNAQGARVVGYDPVGGKVAASTVPELQVFYDPYEALDGAHAAVLITEWDELLGLDLKRAASTMRMPRLLVDGRNAFNPQEAEAAGMLYRGFGRV